MLRLAFDFIITWRETRTRPNAYKRLNQGREKAYATGTNVICCYYGSRKIEPFKNSCQLFSHAEGIY